MRIHRRTVLQAMLVLPVATLATRSQKVCALPHLTHSSPQAHTSYALSSNRWIIDAELTSCSRYHAQDVISALKLARQARPCVLHISL